MAKSSCRVLFLNRDHFVPWENWQHLQTFLIFTTGVINAAGMERAEGRKAAGHPAVHRTPFWNKEN